MIISSEHERITQLDSELVAIIRDFLILTPLSWGKEVQRDFLREARRGNLVLPRVEYARLDYTDKIAALKAFLKKTGKGQHPALVFLRETAESYLSAYHILSGVGTPAVSEYSRQLYGAPRDYVSGYKRRNLDVAKYFLRVAGQYHLVVEDEPLIYSAARLRSVLKKRIAECIDTACDPVTVTVDDHIAARASAGPNYVKLRKGTRYSENDLLQLLHHEVFTHTLTYINGRKQPMLKALGYAAPRTTATQEGLAVFSEYINRSIELVRLKRIALRIIALDMAERGADLVDLFRFFREHGQDVEESYFSAMRLLRGGYPKGGVVFFKDNIYLSGLIAVEGFLKQKMHSGNVHDIALLFAGKLTVEDVERLHLLREEGMVATPSYLPDWARKSGELAAHLAFNDLTERFRVRGE